MPVSSVTEHWIKQDAITINLNHFGDPDYLQVSVLAGAVVMAFKQDVIGYNAAHNYRTWPLQAANTYLETSSAVNVYARLTRSEVNASALIIYDPVLRDIEGREISYEEVEGEKKEVLGDPNPDYFFIYLGEISASLSESGMSVLRDWSVSFRFGSLDTNQFQNEEAGGEWTKMFRLNKVTDLIDVLKTFSNAVFKKLSIKRNDKEKPIVDLKRSIDSDEEVPVSDEIIPTTKYLHSVTDERFLRKDKDDRSVGTISSDKGFEVGDYVPGELGIGGIFKIDENGDSYLEVDKALFRKIAYFVEIMIKKLSHVGGSIILSPASMKCSKVEEHETYYRCYFENEHEGKTINQEFVVGDQARSQEFNIKEGLSQNVSNQYYWRLVVGVGSNYIDLSKTDCDSGSGIPLAGDDIVQLGNRDNPSRQRAIILSSYGEGTPSIIMYRGIKSYSMSDAKMPLRLSPDGNIIEGDFISKSGKNLEEWMSEVEVNWDKVLEQTDKEFSMWFFPYAPSADVVPEVDWVTPELKALHEEDLFYDKSTGLAWRYTFEDGYYFWEIVTDAETIKALEKASKAQETADGAVQRLDSIVSDGKLSAVEKKEVRKEWVSIVDTYEWNMYSSERIGIDMQSQEVVGYSSAYNALSAYITPLLAEDGDSDINPDEYRGYWTDYYTTETKLRNFLSEKAKEKADYVNDRVDDIVSDGVLSSLEKKEVLKEWDSIASSYAINIENANKYNVSHDDYTASYVALGTYLNNGDVWDGISTPIWLNEHIGVNTIINPSEYRQVWVDYYDSEKVLIDSMYEYIKGIADSRIRNFVDQPIPPYDEGDRWCNATYGDLFDDDDLVCVTSKEKGEEFSIEDWRPVSYGKTSIIKNMEGEIKLLADSFELGADGKYYLSKEAGVNITTEMASLYATKTEYNTLARKVSSNSSQINATANSLSAFTEKISFNSSGDITNISKSGLVTTSNYASIFSQYKSQTGAVVQSEISAFVTEGEVGEMISKITITADNVDINNGVVIIDKDSATIGGFIVGKYTLVNEGIGYDSYNMRNLVSLTPYDGRSVGHSSVEVNAMSGGATSSGVTGFSVGIKSEIASVKDENGTNNSYFSTVGGYFEGTATSGNMGSVGVWGKSQYSGGSPYILAGVVGTELASKTGYTKAQAGVIGFSQYNYGVYAKGGKNDIFLANASIGNFGLGKLVTNATSMANFVNNYNVLMSASDATLPRCGDVPMGRMFLYINGGSSVHKVSRSGSDTIAVSTGAGSETSINVYENSAVFFIKIGNSKWYAFKAYDEDE